MFSVCYIPGCRFRILLLLLFWDTVLKRNTKFLVIYTKTDNCINDTFVLKVVFIALVLCW